MTSSAPGRRRGGAASPRGLRGYFHRANLFTSLILVFPLFLLYQLAILVVPDAANGADLITGRLFRVLGGSTEYYLLFNVGLLAIFLALLLVLRGKQQFDLRLFAPVVLESGIYALTMGTAILYVMNAIGINPALHVGAGLPLGVGAAKPGLAARIALSVGAGVHEELVFRLILLSGLVVLFEKVAGAGRAISLVAAFVISAVLFSAAHHVIGGEPFRVGAFTYRFFCGLFFAALFQFRGFAVAVYTHALYDIYVMLFS
jgi:hypothetical protein